MKQVVIIGAGRLGCSLGLALKEVGFSLRAITCAHKESAEQSSQILGCRFYYLRPEKVINRGQIIFFCVPDRQISPLVRKLAKIQSDWSGRFVFHTSGLLSSKALLPLKKLGARIASFHPIQSFSKKETSPRAWRKIFVSIEGDEEALALAREIIQKIGANPLEIAPKNKPLYHAACSLASNHFVSLFSLAYELLEQAGFDKSLALEVLKPLVNGTWKNLKFKDPSTALTGPIVRGDWLTVREHLRALRPFPLALKVYQQLGLQALSLAKERGLSPSKIKTLKRWLQDK